MALPDIFPSPHGPTFPSHPASTYPERSPRFRGPAVTDIASSVRVRNNPQRPDSQWHGIQSHPPRWIPTDDHYDNEYLSGPSSSTDASISERVRGCSPPMQCTPPFYVPRSPPSSFPRPGYQNQNQRLDRRTDIHPAYEYDARPQYHPAYQPPPARPSDQHLLPPTYLQPPMPTYEPQSRWSDRKSGPDRFRPPPRQFMHTEIHQPRERERPALLRAPLPPPPPPPPQQSTVGVQRSYSQARPARVPSSSRRNPYPSAEERRVLSNSASGGRYQGGGGGKRTFEKRSGGYAQRGSGR